MAWVDDLLNDKASADKAQAKAMKPLIEAKAAAAKLEPLEPMINSMATMWEGFDWSKPNAATEAAAIAQAQGAALKSVIKACQV